MRKHWDYNLLQNLLQQQAMTLISQLSSFQDEEESISSDTSTSSDEDDVTKLAALVEREMDPTIDMCMFKTYKTKAVVLSDMIKHNIPLSVVVVDRQ